jgi:hypothetical protein
MFSSRWRSYSDISRPEPDGPVLVLVAMVRNSSGNRILVARAGANALGKTDDKG